jgi:hypothetical protein
MTSAIIVVSGLPRSGTSLMMQMLDRGGVEIVADRVRLADVDNPNGYCEFEPVKAIKRDATWLPATRGKAFKMVSQLLYDLPPSESYRILFMDRDMDEVLLSQEKMLTRLGRTPPPREQMAKAYTIHLERLHEWLGRQANISNLRIRYSDLIARPRDLAERIRAFLGNAVDVKRMVQAVDPALYRNRKATAETVAGTPV